MSRTVASLVLLLEVATAAAAQNPPQSRQRGVTADTAYQVGEIDSVNLFNGMVGLYSGSCVTRWRLST